MKQKLKWIILPNENLYKKVKYSKYIRDKLEKSKINSILFSQNQCVLLHSSFIDID
jgi:hypothetical protein